MPKMKESTQKINSHYIEGESKKVDKPKTWLLVKNPQF